MNFYRSPAALATAARPARAAVLAVDLATATRPPELHRRLLSGGPS